MKITSLDQLAPKTQEYTITNSSSGEEVTVTLKDLIPSEMAELRARVVHPKPPTKGFKKNAMGGVEPEYDLEDVNYVKVETLANYDFVYEWLVESLVEPVIPGETREDKKTALKKTLPMWVFNELADRLREISGFKMSDVAYAKKKSKAMELEAKKN